MKTFADDLRACVAEHADVPVEGDAALDLDSLTLVTLIEALEDRFEIRIAPREVTPENFATVRALGRFIEGKRR